MAEPRESDGRRNRPWASALWLALALWACAALALAHGLFRRRPI
ncbi:hypothetical protein ACV347_30960 [Pseudomonas aeruginosa]